MALSTRDITDLSGNTLEVTWIGPRRVLRRRDGKNMLPGHAHADLQSPTLLPYLRRALIPFHLDKLSPRLWLVSTPHYAHISPLHHQAVRGRDVILTENPHLHLVWYYDRIFIKPIPPYMLSRAFWEYIEVADRELFEAAAGFMRTYRFLIQVDLDFRRAAEDMGLIPTSSCNERLTFEEFAAFITPFADLPDKCVSPRYQYGELRLTRLNWLARIFLEKLTFHHINAQWGSCLSRILAPFIAIFVMLSTILSAMQVELAAQSLPHESSELPPFAEASRRFSVLVLFLVTLVLLFFLGLVIFMCCHDLWFARSVLRRKHRAQTQKAGEMKSGVT
ncbi:hypothetical protein J3458_013428 [Metarhizium acridum]|uniref:uncharacterized protein n=1 Tax=Metarhizium acridum TaxID=92637 RepID=UPI001C6B0A64|nr:hypothetical protein J3458_013428 [Metarhizium acridum]